MPRRIVLKLPDGQSPVLAEDETKEFELQEQLKHHPELLPLDELGLTGSAMVVGRESSLDSGKVDLVLLGSGGDLAIVEFKTGPANPDFRACLAQLIDYGSDLWGMSLEEFETRVASPYFNGPHCPPGSPCKGLSLDEAATQSFGSAPADAIDWRERLQAQLRDGSFHYVAVAQRFTPPVLRTLQYLNAACRAARFSAVELVRFKGGDFAAFEARFVAGAVPAKTRSQSAKTALAGVDALLASVTDDEYRHHLNDLFDGLSTIDGLDVAWGTTGCALHVPIRGRSPLSIGWVFPPGPPRWMGLTDVTLGWYEDANGLALSEGGRAALDSYLAAIERLPSGVTPKAAAIHGRSFGPAAVIANLAAIEEAVRSVTRQLVEG